MSLYSRIIPWFNFLPIVCWTTTAQGQGPETEVRARLDWYQVTQGTLLRNAPLNPDNQVLLLPELQLATDFRPQVEVDLAERLYLVARPRFVAGLDMLWQPSTQRIDHEEASANVLYAQVQVTDALRLSYGLQNFQWGPADYVNASNRFFHVNAFQRTGIYWYPGRELLGLFYTVGQSLSIVGLAEFRPSNQSDFAYGENFGERALVKGEWTSEDGAHYAGLVFGGGRYLRPWLGPYFQLTFSDAFSVHADSAFTLGSDAFYPSTEVDTGTSMFSQTERDKHDPEVLAVTGGRYVTLFGLELSIEYILNTAGYTDSQAERAYATALDPSVSAAQHAENLGRYLLPGLELRRQHYVYASAFWPHLWSRFEVTASLRYLWSISDHSGTGLAYIEGAVSDADAISILLSASHGEPSAELAQFRFGTAMLAWRHSW